MWNAFYSTKKESTLIIHLFYLYSGKFDTSLETKIQIGVSIPISGICVEELVLICRQSHLPSDLEAELSPSPLWSRGRLLSNVKVWKPPGLES